MTTTTTTCQNCRQAITGDVCEIEGSGTFCAECVNRYGVLHLSNPHVGLPCDDSVGLTNIDRKPGLWAYCEAKAATRRGRMTTLHTVVLCERMANGRDVVRGQAGGNRAQRAGYVIALRYPNAPDHSAKARDWTVEGLRRDQADAQRVASGLDHGYQLRYNPGDGRQAGDWVERECVVVEVEGCTPVE